MENQVKHLPLILISLLLLSSFLTSCTKPNGTKYVGEYKNGKRHGQGTLTTPDGRKYVGEYKDGKFHGQGTLTFRDGDKYVGVFKDEEMWTGIFFDNNGNIIGKIVNGIIE